MPYETYIADPPRREVKNGIKARKAARRAQIRESHHNMTPEGVERRVNGNRLGHRRRLQMLRELLASF